MNERPSIQDAIEEYRTTQHEDLNGDPYTVADLADPNEAQGRCDSVGETFAAWLRDRGFDAQMVTTEDCSEWGLTFTHGPGSNPDAFHAATQVDGLIIDWTANQFAGKHSFPRVTQGGSMNFPPVERRQIRDSHGNTREYVRLAGQSSWYRSLASAQIAWQRKGA